MPKCVVGMYIFLMERGVGGGVDNTRSTVGRKSMCFAYSVKVTECVTLSRRVLHKRIHYLKKSLVFGCCVINFHVTMLFIVKMF